MLTVPTEMKLPGLKNRMYNNLNWFNFLLIYLKMNSEIELYLKIINS